MRQAEVLLLFFLAGLLLALLLVSRTQRIIPGAIAVELVAGCQMELYDTSLQPAFTAVLACPKVDSIRLWPLPVLQPWYEDRQQPAPAPGIEVTFNFVPILALLQVIYYGHAQNKGLVGLPVKPFLEGIYEQ